MIRASRPEGLTELIGSTAIGDWVTVSQERIDAFAEVTEDHQWIHVDVERASTGPFGTTIAHGLLTLSLVPGLIRDLIDVQNADAVVNYGVDGVRFLAPVPSGARIRARTELVEAVETDRGVRARLKNTVEIDGSERPALVAETIHLFVSTP
ncbi:MaoC family dehydratase [Microbacterium hominis]|uniref:MaoC family dehydratase n=1 Tax=Microbacterium hominis TaxID=162426 RepID=A0A7D4PLK1_9MICO|nr:MaoC family dehydratase [Microbacterium hominis]